jgi:acyl carrier protein
MRASQLLRNLAAARTGRTPSHSGSRSASRSVTDPVQAPRPAITEDQAFVVIRDAITAVLELPAAGIERETRLAEDLHADSLALVEIVEVVEERLAEGWPGLVPASFRLEDAGLEDLRTVGDAVTYVVTSL